MQTVLHLPVLVLNANYEPLNVSSVRRSIGLMICGKAELVLNGRGVIRTFTRSYQCPSIIRLGRMVKRPRPKIKLSKNEVFRRDGYTCQYCGHQNKQLTIDHVIPKRSGGGHTWHNVVTACAPCNLRKGAKLPVRARMKLMRQPFEPKPTASYRFAGYVDLHAEWHPFIEGW